MCICITAPIAPSVHSLALAFATALCQRQQFADLCLVLTLAVTTPTPGLGALVARKESLLLLHKVYFGGGSVVEATGGSELPQHA